MLKSIYLQNFFGFQDCTINLEKGANVLVGINGSGKSNFFKAIKLLKAALNNKLNDLIYQEFGGLDNMFFAGMRAPRIISNSSLTFTIDFNKSNYILIGEFEVKIEILSILNSNEYYIHSHVIGRQKDVKTVFFEKEESTSYLDDNSKPKRLISISSNELDIVSYSGESTVLRVLLDFASKISSYETFDTSMLGLLRRGNSPRIEKHLLSDGSNLPSLLNYIKISDKSVFNKISESLKNVNNQYKGIDFRSLPNLIELWLEEEKFNRSLPASNVSDGTLKFLCLMAILYNPNRGRVVCIDEPELGLHPDMINTLYEAIEFAAETSQVIISTHSAHLLNYFEIEQVRVFEKDENNATIVNQYSKELYANWQQKFQLGKAWREGDIGGNRW
jgi:predicted ATPase